MLNVRRQGSSKQNRFAENRFSHEDQISGLNFILIT